MMYRDSYRKLKKGFALLIAVCMLTVMIPAEALAAGDEDGIVLSGECGNPIGMSDSLLWFIEEDTLTIQINEKYKDSTNPSMYKMRNYSVSKPAPWAQAGSLFSKVVVGEGVKDIGERAFYGLGIDSAILSSTVDTISHYAFSQSEISEIDFPDKMTNIYDSAFEGCKNLISVSLPEISAQESKATFKDCTSLKKVEFHETNPEKTIYVFSQMFEGCTALTDVLFPEGDADILVNYEAFKNCTGLKKIQFPDTDVNLYIRVFSGCTDLDIVFKGDAPEVERVGDYDEDYLSKQSFSGLKNARIYYYDGKEGWDSLIERGIERYGNYGGTEIFYQKLQEGEEIVEEKEIPLEPGQKTYIEDHRNFISEGTYDFLVDGRDVGSEFLTDFGSLKPDYEAWKAVRGEWFESPYDQVLATMILSEESVETQENAFKSDYLATERAIADDIVALINQEGPDFTAEQTGTIEKILLGEDHSGEPVYEALDELLTKWGGNGVLKKLFLAYDCSSGFLGLLDHIDDGVEVVREMTQKISVLQAYANTDENFRQVLAEMAERAEADGNSDMAKSLNYYVSLEDDYDIEKAIEEVKFGAGAEEMGVIYGEKIKWNVGKFLYNQLSPEIAGSWGAFLGGIVIGYDLTVALDKKLRNTDEVSDAYLYAYGAADLLATMKPVLEENKQEFTGTGDAIDRPAWEKAEQFCHSFGMYTRLSLEVCRKVAEYFSRQMFAGIIDRGGDTGCEALCAQWNLKQLDWLDVKCHSGGIPISGGTTTVINGDEVEIKVCGIDDQVLLEIKDGMVTAAAGTAAAAIADSGMVLISLPKGEEYRITVSSGRAADISSAVYAFGRTGKGAFQAERIAGSDRISLGSGESGAAELHLGEGTELLRIPGESVYTVPAEEFTAAESIRLDKEKAALQQGKTFKLNAQVLPEQATSRRVIWFSDNEAAASVSSNGVVTGIRPGTAVIYCMTPEGNAKASCTVTVSAPVQPTVPARKTKQTISGASSFKKTVNARAFYLKARAAGKLSYRSSNTKVASVSSAGKVTVKGVGSASITITAAATKQHYSASKKVSITVLPQGTKLRTVKPLKGRKARVTWRRSRAAGGYQIQYSRFKSMKKAKKKTVTKNRTTRKTISKLKKGKTYYFRIRTYKKAGGKKYYSAWSGKKRIKIR